MEINFFIWSDNDEFWPQSLLCSRERMSGFFFFNIFVTVLKRKHAN